MLETTQIKPANYVEPVYYITPEALTRSFSGNLMSHGFNVLSEMKERIAPAILTFQKHITKWIETHPKMQSMKFNSHFHGETRHETGYATEVLHTELSDKLDSIIRQPEISIWNTSEHFYFVDLDALRQMILYDMKKEEED